MDCKLCLKNDSIKDGHTNESTEWKEQNIQSIIEKYLWKIENLNICSYICKSCWQELHNFHTFYTNIEKAHSNLNTLIKTENVEISEFPDTNSIDNIDNSQHEPEISLEKQKNPLDFCEKDQVETLCDSKRLKRKCSNKRQKRQNNNCKKRRKKEKLNKLTKESIDDLNQDEAEVKLEQVEENDAKETYSIGDCNEEISSSENSDEVTNTNDSAKTQIQTAKNDKFIADHFELSCNICNKTMENFHNLNKHCKAEHNERGYAFCCKRRYYTRTDLIDHIKLHQNPEQYKCQHCEKILSSNECLKQHIKKLHESRNIECDICGKLYATESGLKTHKLSHEAEMAKEKLPCTQCDKSFISKNLLDGHILKVHLKKYHKICALCGISISTNYCFERHMLKHEGKPLPPVSCKICGRRLSDEKCLKRHMDTRHPPEGVKKEFKCPICMMTLASRNGVRMHVKAVHENYKYNCNLCEKTFKRPGLLKDHIAQHTGETLHACDWCSKSFYSNDQLNAHRKREHPIEWEESIREKYSGNLPEKYVAKTLETKDTQLHYLIKNQFLS